MKKILSLSLAVLLLFSLVACGEAAPSTAAPTQNAETLYSVNIVTGAGAVPTGVKYYVYKDASKQTGIVTYGILDQSGKFAFTAPTSDSYTLVLENVPEGYQYEASYTLKEAVTKVVLNTVMPQGLDAAGKEYELGDIMRDFTITDCEGNTYTISELLKTKKCVVLNFWNIKCDPCKAEFPYLLRAYEAYKDDIALIAMNPVATDNDAKIKEYKDTYGLTFPMASCQEAWITAITPANPTTVIIDRYGRICVKETGSITVEGVFEAVFQHFVSSSYEQILIKDMRDFAKSQAGNS